MSKTTRPPESGAQQTSGLEMARGMIQSGRRPQIANALDFSFIEADDGQAVFEARPGDHIYNANGTAHGGYAATILDSACAMAVLTKLDARQTFTTLELKVSYHKPITMRTGRIRAIGTVLSCGRKAAFAQAEIRDDDGALYASATSTLLVISAP